jgi:hypothetical protein
MAQGPLFRLFGGISPIRTIVLRFALHGGSLLLKHGRSRPQPDGNMLAVPQGISMAAPVLVKLERGETQRARINLGRDGDEDVPAPLRRVDEVAHRKGHVGLEVLRVLIPDHVAPGLVEVPGCHGPRRVVDAGGRSGGLIIGGGHHIGGMSR